MMRPPPDVPACSHRGPCSRPPVRRGMRTLLREVTVLCGLLRAVAPPLRRQGHGEGDGRRRVFRPRWSRGARFPRAVPLPVPRANRALAGRSEARRLRLRRWRRRPVGPVSLAARWRPCSVLARRSRAVVLREAGVNVRRPAAAHAGVGAALVVVIPNVHAGRNIGSGLWSGRSGRSRMPRGDRCLPPALLVWALDGSVAAFQAFAHRVPHIDVIGAWAPTPARRAPGDVPEPPARRRGAS